MNPQHLPRPIHSLAIILSGAANFFLGISSLYWKELGEVSSMTLVAYRITLSAITLTLFVVFFRQAKKTTKVTLKSIHLHCIASLLIAINWGAFIWSSINGYLLESGLGYLLAPFVSIVLGSIVYHEPISLRSAISAIVAFGSVVALIIYTNDLNHFTYLSIATAWGLYTYIKKSTLLDSVNGLLIETLFLTGCLTVATVAFNLPITYPNELPNKLIWLAGAVSIAPLLMLSYSTGKMPLSLTGFLQFILPITLITISIFSNTQQISDTPLTLTLITTGILISLITYDISTSQRQKKDI